MGDFDPAPDAAGPAASGAQEVDLTAPASRPMELATAAVVLLLGVTMLVGARAIVLRNETGGIDARWWPTAIAVGILACGAWMAFNAITGRRGERDVDAAGAHGWAQTIITVALTALVLVLWQVGLSFLLLGPAYLIALNWVYGLRNWKSLLLFPAIIAALLWLVFQLLLKVPL